LTLPDGHAYNPLAVDRLALALLLLLAGLLPSPTLGADHTPAPSKEAAPPSPSSEPREPPRATYTIGALLPLSGNAAWFGKAMRQGMELAVKEIDALAGPRLKLVVEDAHPAQPHEVATAFRKLVVSERALAVFTASATPTLAVLPQAIRDRILVVHGGVVTPELLGASTLLVHTRPSPSLLIESATAWARERGVTRLAVLASGGEAGREIRERLREAWRQRGGSLVAEASLLVDSPDLEARLRQVLRSAPEGIVLGFRGPELGVVVARLRALGYARRLLALDGAPEALLVAGSTAEGMEILAERFAAPAPSEDDPEPGGDGSQPGKGDPSADARPWPARFASAYRAKYGADPERYAANAYEAVHLLASVLSRLPKPLEGSARGDRLRRALLDGSPHPSVYGGVVRLREDGTVVRPLALLTVDGGRPTFTRYLDPPSQGRP